MIAYNARGPRSLLNIFRWSGSVVPKVLPFSAACGVVAFLLNYLSIHALPGDSSASPIGTSVSVSQSTELESAVWIGFSSLVGFLVIFRTNQAYSRFWEGCCATYRMRSEWYDAASSCVAFSSVAGVDDPRRDAFLNVLIRLFSMLHAAALAEIEDSNVKNVEEVEAFRYNLIDAASIDEDTLVAIRESPAKVELLFQWIQQLIVENMDHVLAIPPPILTRTLQELAQGMVAFSDAIRISTCPFPFPYSQICDILLLIHWVFTPIVITQWVDSPLWAGLFTWITVFTFAALNSIALEIENPFGSDMNDIDCPRLQHEFNVLLIQMISVRQKRTPTLVPDATMYGQPGERKRTTLRSFVDVWSGIPGLMPKRTSMRSQSAEMLGSEDCTDSKRPTTLSRLLGRLSGQKSRPKSRILYSGESSLSLYDDVGEDIRGQPAGLDQSEEPAGTSSGFCASGPSAGLGGHYEQEFMVTEIMIDQEGRCQAPNEVLTRQASPMRSVPRLVGFDGADDSAVATVVSQEAHSASASAINRSAWARIMSESTCPARV